MIIQEPVQAAIWHCLNHYAYQDAIFLAERLCAEVKTDDTIFLLATCYYRSGKPGQAYSILHSKGASSPQCKYLMATCCLDLQKLADAESVLTGGDASRPKVIDDVVSEFGDEACFALQLLARISASTERNARANDAYRRSLKLNPFLWKSFEALCDRGEKPDPAKVFQVSNLESFAMCHGNNPVVNFVNNCEHGFGSVNSCAAIAIDTPNNTISSTPIQMLNCFNAAASSVKMHYTPDENPLFSHIIAGHSGIAALPPTTRVKPFKYRSLFSANVMSPMTPSFGVLPLDFSSPLDGQQQPPAAFVTPATAAVHPASTLTEANDQKTLSMSKRVSSSFRAHVGQMISRKEGGPLHQSKPVFSQSGTNNSNIVAAPSPAATPASLQGGQNVRRSSRLFSNAYSVKENNKSPNINKFATPKSPSRKTKASRISKAGLGSRASYNELNERNRGGGGGVSEKAETVTSEANSKLTHSSTNTPVSQNVTQHAVQLQKQSAEGLMALMRDLGAAYLSLAQYQCRRAVEVLDGLAPAHRNTGWVLGMLGKAHYELTEYTQAVRYFVELREREPHRTQLTELYSSALWHLQREVALSALAQDLVAQDPASAAAWCAAGNCFSLQKEHDSAIKFFQRAVQVDPEFVYAYTLLGHEYVTTEELDKAMSCFGSAVRIDSRHYNAWYGIGTIYSKQERYVLAEMSFQRALGINPRSSVLMCHIAVAQHALQKTDRALRTLNAAIAVDPHNPLCKFHRASIYFAAGRHAEALKELEELKEIVPKESLVYYLTGKVHKKLGNTHLALMHFSWATDLDPKGAHSQIKEAIDPALNRTSHVDDENAPAPSPQQQTQTQQREVYYPTAGRLVPVHESSSQEGREREFVSLQAVESDESL